jgi:hypothetical protein
MVWVEQERHPKYIQIILLIGTEFVQWAISVLAELIILCVESNNTFINSL